MKTVDFQGINIRIDRPKGFVQEGKGQDGSPWKRVYKLDYGFIPRTDGGDGEGVDVFVGPNKDAPTAFWATQCKDDGSFDEFKVLVGFSSKEEAKRAYSNHIPSKYLKSVVSVPLGMMRSLLNKDPNEKTAMNLVLAFFDEYGKLAEVL